MDIAEKKRLFSDFLEKSHKADNFLQEHTSELLVMFLGIKPAILWNPFASINVKLLESYGFLSAHHCQWIYCPTMVSAKMRQYPEHFQGYQGAEELMNDYHKWDKDHLRTGIVLGYPYRAAYVVNEHLQYLAVLTSQHPKLIKKIMDEVREGEGSYEEIYNAWEAHADELGLDMEKLSRLRGITKNATYVEIKGIRWCDIGGEDGESRALQRNIREHLNI